MSDPLIVCAGASKRYPGPVPVDALYPADISLWAGEMIALEGPSGSGKSTMLGLLGLLDVPTGGVVMVGGRDTTRMGDRERSRLRSEMVGFVFQQFNLVGHLSALANVETALLYRSLARVERRRLAAAELERVGLGDRLQHRPAQLSGGEQQRVSLARAVVSQPRVILADEPTGNLDLAATEVVLDILGGFISRGVAVVVATHDPMVAGKADRRFRLHDGYLRER